MLVESFDILLERNIDNNILNDYYSVILDFKEVKRIDKIRARELGKDILVDVRLSIDHDKTIKQGHDLTRSIKYTLMNRYTNISEVLIHLNPFYPEENHQHKNG